MHSNILIIATLAMLAAAASAITHKVEQVTSQKDMDDVWHLGYRACVTSEDGLKKLVRPLSGIKSVCQCECQTRLIIFSPVNNRTPMDGTVGLVQECGRMGCNMGHEGFYLNGNTRKSSSSIPTQT